jgi:hypothetical protein
MNGNYSPALNLEGFPGIEGLRNAAPGPVVPGPVVPGPMVPGPVAHVQSLEDAVMPLERTHEELPYPHHDEYDDLQLYDSSPQPDDQDPPMIDDIEQQMIAHTRNLDNIERIMNDARRANLAASNARSAARSVARYANFKGRGQPGGSKSKRKKRRTTRRKKTRKHTRK